MQSPRWTLGITAAFALLAFVTVCAGSYVGGVDFTILGFAIGGAAVVLHTPLLFVFLFRGQPVPRWLAVVVALQVGGGLPFAASPFFSHDIRLCAFERAARRAEPLVAAIQTYEERNGRPPASLDVLVPTYIDAIPSTGIWLHPTFEYAVLSSQERPVWGSTWALQIELTMDSFFYAPRAPTTISTRRLGDWAYHFS